MPENADPQETDVRDSTPNANGPDGAAGGMGVSSERTGPTGPGQHGTDGVRPTERGEPDPDAPPGGEPRGAPAEGGPPEHRPALGLVGQRQAGASGSGAGTPIAGMPNVTPAGAPGCVRRASQASPERVRRTARTGPSATRWWGAA